MAELQTQVETFESEWMRSRKLLREFGVQTESVALASVIGAQSQSEAAKAISTPLALTNCSGAGSDFVF